MTDYTREARELIDLIECSSHNGVPEVADWLRELVAALSSGCTGRTADPDGPELTELRPDHTFGPACPNYPYGCVICLPGRTVAKPGKVRKRDSDEDERPEDFHDLGGESG